MKTHTGKIDINLKGNFEIILKFKDILKIFKLGDKIEKTRIKLGARGITYTFLEVSFYLTQQTISFIVEYHK